MQPAIINSAFFQCVEHSNGHPELAAEFIACLRADEAWSVAGVDMVEYLALPIVSEPLVFELFIGPPQRDGRGYAGEVWPHCGVRLHGALMQPAIINSAVFQCVEHSNGHPELAAEFIACLRADEAWSVAGVDMVEYLALPIVSEPLVFELFIGPLQRDGRG